jgi:hypothetical protein
MPSICPPLTGSPSSVAAKITADTGASAVNSDASVPLTRAAPAYQSTKPPTVGTMA